MQAGLLVNHGLPVAESRNKVKILVRRTSFWREIFLTELLTGIRETYRSDLFVHTNFNLTIYSIDKSTKDYRKHVLLRKETAPLL